MRDAFAWFLALGPALYLLQGVIVAALIWAALELYARVRRAARRRKKGD